MSFPGKMPELVPDHCSDSETDSDYEFQPYCEDDSSDEVSEPEYNFEDDESDATASDYDPEMEFEYKTY